MIICRKRMLQKPYIIVNRGIYVAIIAWKTKTKTKKSNFMLKKFEKWKKNGLEFDGNVLGNILHNFFNEKYNRVIFLPIICFFSYYKWHDIYS